jgi:hypothetical protein
MKIETNASMTVAALRALIAGAEDSTQIEFVRTIAAKPKMTGECWCGCGGETKSKFVPGHDSKFHGLAKKVARGEAEMPTSFIHEDAEADFMKWHDAALEAEAAKPAKVKPEPKAAKPKAEVEPTQEAEVDNEVLDEESDEFKALVASVMMA